MEAVTRMVISQENIAQVVQEWLGAVGRPSDTKIEMYFLSDGVLIRPQMPENQKLEEWLEGAMSRYDSLLRRLAES
jgi:hypothetical protein